LVLYHPTLDPKEIAMLRTMPTHLLAPTAALLLVLAAAGAATAAIVTETIHYEHDGVTFEGYLAYDDAISGPRPGVLIIHQWMGLSANERMRAEKLAELGYVALAGDVYGQGVRPQNTDEASAMTGKFYADRMLFRGRLHAGLTALKEQPLVDRSRCAAIGYCFGGTGVLELARMGAEVAGVVSFHGGLKTSLPAGPGETAGKILVCHGAVDPYVPPAEVQGFVEEMEAAGADYQLIMYADAVHSFTQKEAGDDPSRGAAYQAKADRRSWEHMRVFFVEIFD
jgi:dienelactone hydrolase